MSEGWELRRGGSVESPAFGRVCRGEESGLDRAWVEEGVVEEFAVECERAEHSFMLRLVVQLSLI